MYFTRTSTFRNSPHLQQVEALLAPIRCDRSINEAERRRQIDEVIVAANARALSVLAARRQTVEPMPVADEIEERRWQRELARVG